MQRPSQSDLSSPRSQVRRINCLMLHYLSALSVDLQELTQNTRRYEPTHRTNNHNRMRRPRLCAYFYTCNARRVNSTGMYRIDL